MKAGFPLPAAEAAKVIEALGLPAPTALRASYALDEFLAQFAAPGSAVRAVAVRERRPRYTVGGYVAELSWRWFFTACYAHPGGRVGGCRRGDAVVRDLGSAATRTPAICGAWRLIDDQPERYAIIDAGTNRSVPHRRARGGRRWRSVVDRAEVTRLGEGLVPQGAIVDAALQRTVKAMAGMADEAKRHGVRAIAAVGTAGLRMASNGAEVFAAIRARTGIGIEVISAKRKAGWPSSPPIRPGREAGSLRLRHRRRRSQFSFGHAAAVDERSASTLVPCATPSATARPRRHAAGVARGARGDRHRPVAPRRPAVPDALVAWAVR